MGADVLIHRCTLRIARKGGWSWGADRRALLEAAMRRLPELIAARLGESFPADAEYEIAAPLRLRMSLRLDDLLALAVRHAGETETGTAVTGSLAQRVDLMVQGLVRADMDRTSGERRDVAVPDEASAADGPDVQAQWGGIVLSVLLGWHRRDLLAAQLLSFSPASLSSWHDSLSRLPQPPGSPPGSSVRPGMLALAVALADLPLPLPAGRIARLIRRITLMVSVAQDYGVSPGDPVLADVLAAHLPIDLPIDETRRAAHVDDRTFGETPAEILRRDHPAAPPRRSDGARPGSSDGGTRTAFDVHVSSALPFLLLGPLSRTGYLQVLSAVCDAANLLPELPCVAVALARKVLDPPRRGWLRSADAVAAAAACAGRIEPPDDPRLAAVARRLSPQLSPLDTLVAQVLTEGHTPGRPLLLQAAPMNGQAGWMLCEEDGLFPIAWCERIEHLYPRLAALGGELLLVPEAALADDLLDRLDSLAFRFVTDARPARGRSWRALHKGGLRAWTNDRDQAPGPLVNAAGRLEAGASGSHALWQALTVERPALPAGSESNVERSLALASALALGTIAWTLWRGRETVTPLLALQRFADLDGRVSFRPDRVQVHLPLGRRFLDLKQAGLLEDIADVPWFGGRPLRFGQG